MISWRVLRNHHPVLYKALQVVIDIFVYRESIFACESKRENQVPFNAGNISKYN